MAVRWIAYASQAEVDSRAWRSVLLQAPTIPPDEYETARAATQVRAYLALGATLLWTFIENDAPALAGPVDRLTTARAKLATEPEVAWAAVSQYRSQQGLPTLPEPT
jgi:hypothetical protein